MTARPFSAMLEQTPRMHLRMGSILQMLRLKLAVTSAETLWIPSYVSAYWSGALIPMSVPGSPPKRVRFWQARTSINAWFTKQWQLTLAAARPEAATAT